MRRQKSKGSVGRRDRELENEGIGTVKRDRKMREKRGSILASDAGACIALGILPLSTVSINIFADVKKIKKIHLICISPHPSLHLSFSYSIFWILMWATPSSKTHPVAPVRDEVSKTILHYIIGFSRITFIKCNGHHPADLKAY